MNDRDSTSLYYGAIPARELADAINFKLLTQEEARDIYYAQYPTLAKKASLTAPPIKEAA